MASKLMKPTRKQLSEAVDALADMFPEEAASLKQHHSTIVGHLHEGTEPAPNSALALLKLKPITTSVESYVSPPCAEACAKVAVDIASLILRLLRSHTPNQEKTVRGLLEELGYETVSGFSRVIRDFNEAKGAHEKAKAYFRIMDEVWKAGGFRVVFKMMKDKKAWWEWVKNCAVTLAHLTEWVATKGVVLIEEIASTILSDKQLIEDSLKCVQVCM
jgi:hypothetical protein